MKKYNIIAILSEQSVNNEISPETKQRIKLGLELKKRDLSDILVMSGKEIPGNRTNEGLSYAFLMREYAISFGVCPKSILLEEESLDTVGQAFFIKKNILIPNHYKSMVVVSSDYHIKRVKIIFDFICGKDYNLKYFYANTIKMRYEKTKNKEEKSLNTFLSFFKEIESGNDEQILKKLFTSHPLYKNS